MIPLMVAIIAIPRGMKNLGRPAASSKSTTCPDCGAEAPVTTPEGFIVCSACGLEYPNSQPYVCSDALAHCGGIIQSHMIIAPHTRRTIGTKREQATLPRALAWGEKISVTYEQEVFLRGYFEIRKALAHLDLEGRDPLFDASMAAFVRAYRRTPKGGRCHNAHLLALVATYRVLRAVHLAIPKKRFLASCLDHSRFSEQTFNAVLQETAPTFPVINRNAAIPHEVSAIITRLDLPKELAEIAAKITRDHIRAFRSPKPAVAAAAIIGVSVIIADARIRFPLSTISKHAGVATSAVLRCINGACLFRKHPVEGSIIHAGSCLRAIFAPNSKNPLTLNPSPTLSSDRLAYPTPAPAINASLPDSGQETQVSSRLAILKINQNYHNLCRKILPRPIAKLIPEITTPDSGNRDFWQKGEGGTIPSLNIPRKIPSSPRRLPMPLPERPPGEYPSSLADWILFCRFQSFI